MTGSRRRIFAALVPPPDVQQAVFAAAAEVLAPAGRALRSMAAEHLHVTLVFLGDTPEDRLPAVRTALDRTALTQGALELALAGTGGFPSLMRPRVLWAAIRAADGGVGLEDLQRGVAHELRARGFELDDRPFRPHLTLARPRGRDARLPTAVLEAFGALVLDLPWRATEVALVESRLGADVAQRYPILARSRLSG